MKKILLAALAALAVGLAGCSNPAEGLPVSVPQVGEKKEEAREPAAETRQQEQQQQEQQQEQETWPQIVPVDFNVDLEGFEECPKDEAYGINWVFVRKWAVDDESWREKHFKGEDFRLKPVELHKSNPEGVEFGSSPGGRWRPDDVYKCVAYRKPGSAGKSLFVEGCLFHYVPDGDNGYYQTHNLSVTRVASQKTKVGGGERFREVYKY